MKHLRSRIFALCGVVTLCAAWALPAAARPVAAEDLFKLRYIDDAQISPDGSTVAIIVSHLDGPSNGAMTTIDLVDTRSGKLTEATKGKHDNGIAWAPNGKSFYFVRTDPRTKHPQIFRYTLARGTIEQLTHVKDGFVNGPAPSHDGKHLAFTVVAVDPPHDAYIDFAKAGFTPKAAQKKTDIRTIDRLFFQLNGQGYVYDKHPHLWVMDADGANAHALTSGSWGEAGPQWSPDDKTIAFNSLRREVVDSGPNDIYTIAATGGAIHKLASPDASNNLLFYSHAASDVVYSLDGGVEDPAEYGALVASHLDGSGRRDVIAKNTLSWGDDLLADMKEGGGLCGDIVGADRAAIMNVNGPGYANLVRIDLQTGALTDVTPKNGEAWACTISHDGSQIAYLRSDFSHPVDLYVTAANGGTPRQLTHFNDAYLASVTLSKPEPFTVKDPAGFNVAAWFMPATTGAPGTKHPTLLDIHGGPETQFGDTFFQEFQYWTSLGYNVVFSNPRGSVGYGHAFEAALTKDYGNAMFEDVQAAMDAAITRPGVDSSRLGVLGGSYGGYATLWVIGHTTRYKAAIAERVVSDMQSENFGADFASKNGLGGFYAWGAPWDSTSMYRAISPLTYVENVKTPLLILHSDEDTRTPLDSTLQWFTLAKILGEKIEYVAVPGENHDLSRTGAPIHRVERLTLLANWFNRELKP